MEIEEKELRKLKDDEYEKMSKEEEAYFRKNAAKKNKSEKEKEQDELMNYEFATKQEKNILRDVGLMVGGEKYRDVIGMEILGNTIIEKRDKFVVFLPCSYGYEYDQSKNEIYFCGATGRTKYMSVQLPTGDIFICGGETFDSRSPVVCRLFEAKTKQFIPFGKLELGSSNGAAILLLNAHVLVIGGHHRGYDQPRCELFNILTRTSRVLRARLRVKRREFSVSLLPDGKVFICGGIDGENILSSTEIYDPANESFTDGPSMLVERFQHVATLLLDGRVLICCGDSRRGFGGQRSAELFDYKTNTFTSIRDTISLRPYFPSATVLKNGKVLIFGGDYQGIKRSNGFLTSEIFDPKENTFSYIGPDPTIW